MTRPSRTFSWAFTSTAFAIACLAAGLSGFNLSIADRLATGTHWTGSVIWWEVRLGLCALPVAALAAYRANKLATERSRQ